MILSDASTHDATAMELEIRHVSKTYANGVQALKDVTLTIPAGVYGLLGPRGAGKSTLMSILATRQEADTGSVTLAPSTGSRQVIDVLKQKDEVRKTLGYLPQECPQLSAEALLGQLGNQKLLLVDEPMAADPAERARFLNRLHELGESRIVLLSTQIVDAVRDCTRMAIINEGRIVLEAEPLRAIADLSGRIWERVIAKEALPKVERDYAVVSTKLVAGGIVVRVFSHTAPAVGFERVRPNLEDVYLTTILPELTRAT